MSTKLDDTDINAQRHIRGAVRGLVAGVRIRRRRAPGTRRRRIDRRDCRVLHERRRRV